MKARQGLPTSTAKSELHVSPTVSIHRSQENDKSFTTAIALLEEAKVESGSGALYSAWIIGRLRYQCKVDCRSGIEGDCVDTSDTAIWRRDPSRANVDRAISLYFPLFVPRLQSTDPFRQSTGTDWIQIR